jgi:hypothetical protein
MLPYSADLFQLLVTSLQEAFSNSPKPGLDTSTLRVPCISFSLLQNVSHLIGISYVIVDPPRESINSMKDVQLLFCFSFWHTAGAQ